MSQRAGQLLIDIQDRDLLVLRGLFESRVMTLAHISALYFEGRTEAAKKRVQKLQTAGLIRERPRRVYEPAVLFLTRKAFALLSERGQLADYPPVGLKALEKRSQVSDLTLRHELEVMDIKAAIITAVNKLPNFRVAEFSTWPLLYQFQALRPAQNGYGQTEVLVKPDAFIRIHEEDAEGVSEHAYFLEVDRSTETQETLALRAACYADYYRSGGYAVRQGGRAAEYKLYPFLVLMVFKSADRRDNAAMRMLQNQPPIHTQVWLTTFGDVVAAPLGPIWLRPTDYRPAIDGTPLWARTYPGQRRNSLVGESSAKACLLRRN